MRKNSWGTRTLAVSGAAVLALTLSACGGPSESDVRDAMKKDIAKSAGSALSKDKQEKLVDCMTDVYMEYADSGDLQKYVDGEMEIEKVKGEKSEEADAEAEKCAESVK